MHKRLVDYDQHGVQEAIIYDGLKLEPGLQLTGPAVIQEPSTTLVVSPGHQVSVDEYGNYHVKLSQASN